MLHGYGFRFGCVFWFRYALRLRRARHCRFRFGFPFWFRLPFRWALRCALRFGGRLCSTLRFRCLLCRGWLALEYRCWLFRRWLVFGSGCRGGLLADTRRRNKE